MDSLVIRPFEPADLPILKQIVQQAFAGVSIDEGIEQQFGRIGGHDWQWRKARHLDDDLCRPGAACFVAECAGRVIGGVTTWQDTEAHFGHIPNIAIEANSRGQGVGRQLLERALDHFRECGLTHARIETLQQNARGNHLYTSLGFREVARQIHFVAEL